MHAELFLDTARLGRMCHRARMAEQQFCWLASQLGSPLYLEKFLTSGFHSLPRELRQRVSGLSCWHGIHEFEESLGQLVGKSPGLPTYFFGQSADMIRLAGDVLFACSDRVLTTDLCWPPYLDWLTKTARERHRKVHVVRLHDLVSSDKATSADVIDYLNMEFQRTGCNGLFLSDISYLGVRLPVEELVAQVNAEFVVVDGAQAIHHRRVDLSKLSCDLYLAGTQKWLNAYQPLRTAFVARQRHDSAIHRAVQSLRTDHRVDTLFQFCEQLQTAELPPFGTTANVTPLICAAGAVRQAHEEQRSFHDFLEIPRTNAITFIDWIADTGWRPLRLDPSLSSGIVRLLPKTGSSRIPGCQIRQVLYRHGIVATSYDDSSLRFSMPTKYLTLQQLTEIRRALWHTAIETCN